MLCVETEDETAELVVGVDEVEKPESESEEPGVDEGSEEVPDGEPVSVEAPVCFPSVAVSVGVDELVGGSEGFEEEGPELEAGPLDPVPLAAPFPESPLLLAAPLPLPSGAPARARIARLAAIPCGCRTTTLVSGVPCAVRAKKHSVMRTTIGRIEMMRPRRAAGWRILGEKSEYHKRMDERGRCSSSLSSSGGD